MKYPNLKPIEHAPSWLSGAHKARIARGMREVCARCNCRAWIDTFKRIAVFGREDHDGVVVLYDVAIHLFRPDGGCGGFDPVLDDVSVDDAVYVINLARVPSREQKDRWAKGWKDKEKHDKAELVGKSVDENMKASREYTERAYEKHTMGRHYKRAVALS